MLTTLLIVAALTLAFQTQRGYGLSNSPSKLSGSSLLDLEQKVVELVNGSRAYDYDLELENIAYRHPDFRSAGSLGANETATWIKEQFLDIGLEAWLEPFEFTNWTLLSKPSLAIDEDGNQTTTGDQEIIGSFQCEHYSWFTPSEGVFADLVVLPLPTAANHTEIGKNPIDQVAWDAIDTTGKILLIGREVRMFSGWATTFVNKIQAQPPAAIVYTWWYSWMSFTPPFFSSAGGVPMGGGYYWNLQIPVGSINYKDGLWIRNTESTSPTVAANVTIRSLIGNGTHYNVVGRITGLQNPEKIVIISSHYDTVMCSGFCDNGAGTAGLLELAGVFVEAAEREFYKPSYTLLFVAFTGEEQWLVGSANYVKQHKSDMANITAVINLDCIGSNDLCVSETPGSDLAQTVVQAAGDLGVSTTMEQPGGSDHESFRSPSGVNDMILMNWGVNLGISDATQVASSTMLSSYPLFYSDMWYRGEAGWIHTAYDNSTSTVILKWVETADLEDHIKVAALTIMRLSPNLIPEFPPNIALALFMTITLFVYVLVRKKFHQPKLQI